jgi:YegS/Rv2252/BmrU family lipid kinase
MQLALIVNPVKVDDAAALDAALAEAAAQRGWPAPLMLATTQEDPGRGMAEAAVREGAQVVLAAGGDGTVAAVVSGLVGTGVPLAVLPSGTGNLLARNLELPNGLDGVLSAITDGATLTIDVGEVVEGATAGSSFAVMAGLGFDADVMVDAPEGLKGAVGWPAYVVSALGHLTDEPFDCTIVVDDGEPLTRSVRSVLVANMTQLQGGIDLAPAAGASDGQLDVVVVSPQGALDWLRLSARLALGSDREDERLERLRGRRVEISTSTQQVCQLDGDPVGGTHRLVVEVRPGALALCVPAGADPKPTQAAGTRTA